MTHFEKTLATAIDQLEQEFWTCSTSQETVDREDLEIEGLAVPEGSDVTRHALSLSDDDGNDFGPTIEIFHASGVFRIETDWNGSFDTILSGRLDDRSISLIDLLDKLREGERISRESRG